MRAGDPYRRPSAAQQAQRLPCQDPSGDASNSPCSSGPQSHVGTFAIPLLPSRAGEAGLRLSQSAFCAIENPARAATIRTPKTKAGKGGEAGALAQICPTHPHQGSTRKGEGAGTDTAFAGLRSPRSEW
jgi:hypothetical protein